MTNALTDETRDARLKLDVDGLCDTLRTPDALKRLVMEWKPAAVSVGDFALRAMLDAILIRHMVVGDYRAIQRLLGTFFGEPVTPGTSGDERHHPLPAPRRT